MLKKVVIYSLEHRIVLLLLVGVVSAIGLGAFLSLSTDLLPDLSFPVITVIHAESWHGPPGYGDTHFPPLGERPA